MDPDVALPCHVDLDSAQTTRTITAAYDRLHLAIATHPAVVVHCESVYELDVSLIQLILAARRSANRAGKELTLSAPATGKLRTALERAGFLAGSDAAFWLNETRPS